MKNPNKHPILIFGPDFKALRQKLNMSLDDVAGELGISKGTIWKFEENCLEPQLFTYVKLFDWYRLHKAANARR